ncbi:MAG: hypothetical protein IKV97_06435 [Clostridia bacterium]|nr:hypothetical protein [Clostridia bacterium]
MPNTPIETERKFLIKHPDINILAAIPGVKIKNMVQTYLNSEKGVTLRVRKAACDGLISYVRTEKKRISAMSCFEDEKTISKTEYDTLLCNADTSRHPIEKTRYCIPHDGVILEIDIYSFWNDRAILEIELVSESQTFTIPDFIDIIKEVTDDKRYKNASLAKEVVTETL